MARTELVRHYLTLKRDLSDRLEEASRAPGVYKNAIIAAAIDAWLDRKATDELELRFGRRLDKISYQLARIERNGRVELESIALFVRYMLTVNAPLPEADEAARAIGSDRFTAFVERVGRHLAKGRLSFLPGEEG
ncbi:MAG TPA: CopG family transcriptional regulator [Sphingomicrobium sp.]|nr:CopG family transcriptional regulator [Sphingomicrobium sp.]